MEYLWIYLSLAAGTFQAFRNATSKKLAKKLKPTAVTLVRFSYAIPLVVIYLLALNSLGINIGDFTLPVLYFSLLAAVFQAIANSLLVYLFQFKKFAVSVNFASTDEIFAAIFGILLFSQFINFWGWVAIFISAFGILYSNLNKEKVGLKQFMHQFTQKSTMIGLASGAFFAFSSFMITFSNRAFHGGNVLANSAMTLLIVLVLQTIILLIDIYIRNREQLQIIMQNKQVDFLIGTSSGLGSICWFLAFSLANIAYVRTVGKIEIVWTFLFTHLLFKEKLRNYEWIGITFTAAGIILLAFTA